MKTSDQKPPPAYAGIDIGKASLDLSLAGQAPCRHANDAPGIAALIKLLKKLPQPGQVICEPSGGYPVGEAFGHCRVGLKRQRSGQTEIYFANRLLGHLVFDPAERFRPPAYIAPPNHKPLALSHPKPKSKM